VSGWAVAAAMCAGLVAAGWPWAALLPGARPPWPARAGLAYLAGAALVSLGMMLVALIGLPITRATVLLSFVVCGGVGLAWLRRGRPAPLRRPVDRGGHRRPAQVLLGVAVLALGLGVAQAVLGGPVDHIDFIRAWGLKGIEVFTTQDLSFPHVSQNWRFYPLEIPNMFAALYILLGRVDDSAIRLPLALYGCSMAAALWWMLRLVLPQGISALALALAVTTPEFVTLMGNGLADVAVASSITIAAVAAFLWLEDGGADWAALSGFMAGAAAWTKLEGVATGLVILAGVLLVRRSLRPAGLLHWLGWLAAFTVPWEIYQRLHRIDFSRAHFRKFFPDVPWIAEHVTSTLIGITQWGVFWPMCVAVIALAAPWWWRTRWRWLAAVTLPNLLVTAVAYIFHYRAGSAISVEATAHRLYLHLAPSVAVMTAVAAHVVWCQARGAGPPPEPGE
jgi:hypothetical protein